MPSSIFRSYTQAAQWRSVGGLWKTALELLGGDIKYAEKVSGGGSDQQHGSGAYHDCVSGIAMLVSSFQDRAGRLELQVQKSG